AVTQAEHRDLDGVGDGRRAAADLDGPTVDEDEAGRVAADGDGVGQLVAENGQDPGPRREEGGNRRDEPGLQALEVESGTRPDGTPRREAAPTTTEHCLQECA